MSDAPLTLTGAYADRLPPAGVDELVGADTRVRPASRAVGAVIDVLGSAGLQERRAGVARLLADDGVTYRPYGAPDDQPWLLDPVPVVVDAGEWAALEPALAQRTRLLDRILADLYGPRELLARGLLPPEVVFGHAGFIRAVDQIRLPGPRQLFLAAADLARDADGRWTVLADRTQAPSGAGYAMENRRVVSRALPGLHRTTQLQRVGPFFQAMRVALQQLSPAGQEAPRVVLLTSGVHSETAFDQAFLASLLGFPLVAGADLTVRDGRVWQRSVDRLEPVDVILRRVDSRFCDPLELRPDSQLGVPGLVQAARLGTVSIANPLGSGVLENPALFPYLPAICAALLDEPLRLPSATTWWCGEEQSRQHVLANLDRLVIKPASRVVARGSRFGWELSAASRDELARRIAAEPHGWVGQEPVPLSTAPTVGPAGLEPRPIVLRTFAVTQGGSYRVMSGGLVRAAATPDATTVTNQEGATSKDIWVLADAPQPAEQDVLSHAAPGSVAPAVSPRVAEELFWLGRYAERAEAVARLVRIADNRWRDVHPSTDPALARCLVVLLEALTTVTTTWPGFTSGAHQSEPTAELHSLVADEQRVGTLAHDVRRMRELAGAVRDQLSSDTWIVFGTLDRVLTGIAADADELPMALARLLEALLGFAGLVGESMVRDTGWYFLDAGRRLERALQLSELLRACLTTAHAPQVEDLVVESVLVASDSIITHRRRYPARGGVDTVLDLLLTDHGNPRSIAFQLDRIGADLDRLPVNGETTRRLLDVRARLTEADAARLAQADGSRRTGLDRWLRALSESLRELALAVEQAHFTQPGPVHSFDPLGLLEPVS